MAAPLTEAENEVRTIPRDCSAALSLGCQLYDVALRQRWGSSAVTPGRHFIGGTPGQEHEHDPDFQTVFRR
jgi:hypothetical protein